jgi:nucleotide-binding universal stress UspA family protein
MYERILIAVDGSETSQRALAEALALAKVHRSQLRIVHAVDIASLYLAEAQYAGTERLEAALVEAGKRILAEAAATAGKAGLPADTRLVEIETLQGRVADVIVQEARAWQAALIVVGTHGRRGLSHLFLGSVAEGVVRIAPVPVLLIRAA